MRLKQPSATSRHVVHLPIEIGDEEFLVRVIKSPYHVNRSGTALKKSAFFPPAGSRELSVIRQEMGDDFCKDKGVEIVSHEDTAAYVGLAAGRCGLVRGPSCEVVDYRKDFLGHAHLVFEAARARDEPLPADVTARLNNVFDALVTIFNFHIDKAPTTSGWPGPPLSGMSVSDV